MRVHVTLLAYKDNILPVYASNEDNCRLAKYLIIKVFTEKCHIYEYIFLMTNNVIVLLKDA